MYRDSLATRFLAAVLVLSLGVFSVGFTWAAVDDYATRDVMPKGASVDGVNVGGLTYADAVKVVEEKVKGPLLQPVDVTFADKTLTVDPKEYVEIDVAGMLAEAAQPKVSSTLPERVVQRVTGSTVGHDVERRLKVDAAKLESWVGATKQQMTIAAIDATLAVAGSSLKVTSAKDGRTLESSAALAAISDALTKGTKTVALSVVPITPKIKDKDLGKTIIVVRSRKSLTLWNGAKIEKKFPIAVGTPGHPTPLGRWRIVNKRYMPTWVNPGSEWAKSMPPFIAPGPGNPLGTRALDLDASGIRIHGSSADYSIGTAASHGCMRMHMWDIEDLYPRVPVGTRVFILP
jgi:lipoprotein-anchoring transpeptidase ErfK/SrfK